MHDHRGGANHLLRQIPLTISPFVRIPAAVTLPYSYEALPLGLPPPSTVPEGAAGGGGGGELTSYITSLSGNIATTPEAIIRSCHALIQHLQAQSASAEQDLRDWEKGIEERELMEKRRIAPGYLDTGLHILEPTRNAADTTNRQAKARTAKAAEEQKQRAQERDAAGEELDRVFGRMDV